MQIRFRSLLRILQRGDAALCFGYARKLNLLGFPEGFDFGVKLSFFLSLALGLGLGAMPRFELRKQPGFGVLNQLNLFLLGLLETVNFLGEPLRTLLPLLRFSAHNTLSSDTK